MSSVHHLHVRRDSGSSSDESELFKVIAERSFSLGDFTLSSGEKSNWYFDLKPTMMNANGNLLAARAFLRRIEGKPVDYVGGLEMGAVPIMGGMAVLSQLNGHPLQTLFVRKERKAHGTAKLVEGLADSESLSGKRVCVVDDVATKGGSILQAVDAIREAGGVVEDALVLVDREAGATAFLGTHGVALHSVFRWSDFRDLMR